MNLLHIFFKKNKPHIFNKYNDNKIIIFSWTRTGSSNLGHIIELHPKIKYIAEPFNIKKKIITKKPNNISELKKSLQEEIWPYCNCIKHNHGLSKRQNEYLLTHPQHNIIFLYRKNALKRAISQQIALKTNVWGLNEEKTRKIEKMKNISLPMLDIKAIKNEMNSYLAEVAYYKKIMTENNKIWFDITFEDLFENLNNRKIKLKLIKKIFDFIEVDKLIDNSVEEQIYWKLDPNNMKQSKYYKYKDIPNFDKIVNLGSTKYGYL